MREYEVMLILPPDVEDPTVQGVVDKISTILGDNGEVGEVTRWGRRRLAHIIAHQSEGYYLIVNFKSDPDVIVEMNRILHLADDVLRFKVVNKAA